MADFFESCVQRYLDLAGPNVTLSPTKTPYLDDDQRNSVARGPNPLDGDVAVCTWCERAFCTTNRKFPSLVAFEKSNLGRGRRTKGRRNKTE